MSSIDDNAGTKHLPDEAHVDRMRFRLFIAIRKSGTYRRILELVKAGTGLGTAVSELNLVQNGEPARWAMQLIRIDALDRFDFDPDNELELLHAMQPSEDFVQMVEGRELAGWLAVWVTPLAVSIGTYYADRLHHDPRLSSPSAWSDFEPQRPLTMGDAEWERVEREAFDQLRGILATLRSQYEGRMRSIRGGNDPKRDMQLQRLAFRLLKLAGRNAPHTDRRLCKTLGIDVPSWP